MRIALSYVVLVVATAGVLAALLGGDFEAKEEAALRARLADQARAVAHDAAPLLSLNAPENATNAQTNALAHEMASLFGTRVTLIRPDGVVVGDSEEDPTRMENHASRPEVAQALSQPGAVGSSTRVSATVHRPLLYVGIAITNPGTAEVLGVARVAYPLTAVEQARNTLLVNALVAVLLVSIPAALLGVLLVRSIVGPLSNLQEAARRFGKGDLAARSGVTTGGEIGALNREFNAMARQLGDTLEERTAARNRMAAVLANMHDGVITIDERGLVDSINPAASHLFNVSQEKALGHSLIEVTHSHELHQALLELLSQPGEYRRMELQVGNRTVAAVVTVAPDSGAENKSARLLVLQDISELRRLERVRRDFVANIGHELRTPLTSVKLLVETVREAMHDDTQAAEDFLGQIEAELDRLTQLVRELLELSRIESGQVELHRTNVDMPGLLEEVASRLRAQADRAGVRLTVEPGRSLSLIYADRERIEQVLVNLVHNAIKFTNPGGSVTLGAEADNGDDGGGDEVCISVRDTGVGIPPNDLPRIFERFYKVDKARAGSRDRTDGQGSEGGTGLGLAIAKHVIQAHGGRIWAESVHGQGSTFYFTLPIAASQAEAVATSSR